MYKIKLEQFEGPLSLLLQLIEKEDLDINQISLAKIADEYIEYINHQADLRLEELADFLVIASKLLYIKSKSLLPYLIWEEEEEAMDLEQQLKLYKEFQNASMVIDKLIKNKTPLVSRERVVLEYGFYPPSNITKDILSNIYASILMSIEPLIKVKEIAKEKVVSIKEKINNLKEKITAETKVKFWEFISKAKNKTEIIVSFLALLELIKQKTINVSQEDLFKDIIITKK